MIPAHFFFELRVKTEAKGKKVCGECYGVMHKRISRVFTERNLIKFLSTVS